MMVFMIFDVSEDSIESEKERNFYVKFFSGYFFNELVTGAGDRLEAFREIVTRRAGEAGLAMARPLRLALETTHVTFDLHGYLLGDTVDRGEAADVLVHDRAANVFVPIEVKFLQSFNVETDVKRWLARLDRTVGTVPEAVIVPCLLLTRTKLRNLKRQASKDSSHWTRFETDYSDRVIVIEWEELVDQCDDDAVRRFAMAQVLLRKDGSRYSKPADRFIRPGWGT